MASITINFSNAHAVRIQGALEESIGYEDVDGNPRAATTADLKAYVISKIVQFTRTSERRVAQAAIVTAEDPDIT